MPLIVPIYMTTDDTTSPVEAYRLGQIQGCFGRPGLSRSVHVIMWSTPCKANSHSLGVNRSIDMLFDGVNTSAFGAICVLD